MSKNKRPSAARDIYQEFNRMRQRGMSTFAAPSATETQFIATNIYRRKLTELAINRFKWFGLPPTVNQRFLETSLFQNALSVFYHDHDVRVTRSLSRDAGEVYTNQFMALRGAPIGQPNMQDDPTAFRIFRNPLPSIVRTNSECVPIWANISRTPDLDMIEYYARRFATHDTTIEVNMMNARQTKVIYANQDNRLSLSNVQRQIVEGEPAIYYSDGAGNLNDVTQVLDLGINPEHIEKLSIVKARIWAECMNMLGINAASTEKKERVVTGEVDQNDDQVMTARAMYLSERQAAAERINRKYGLQVRVEYRHDIEGVADSMFKGTYVPGQGVSE